MNNLPSVGGVTMWPLVAGDYVEAILFQDTGGALNTVAVAPHSVEFWGVWVHP